MKTIEDLTVAVKRYLTSNTQLVNWFQGSAQSEKSLDAQIDEAILAAANNARKYAERLHEFSFSERIGRATLTSGCPLSLNHVPVKKFSRDRNAVEIENAIRLDWDENEWPELVLEGEPPKTNIESVSFHGAATTGFEVGKKYHVIEIGENSDNDYVLRLGIAPGELPDISGYTIWADTAEFARFKTVKNVNLYDMRTRLSVPIRTHMRRTESIRNQRINMLSFYDPYPHEPWTEHTREPQAICTGEFITVEPPGDTAITVDGNVWLPEYTKCTDTDQILQNGFDFMMWQSIVEVNHMLLKFVPRQEGTIAPPTQARDVALESLIVWDSTRHDGNLYHDL